MNAWYRIFGCFLAILGIMEVSSGALAQATSTEVLVGVRGAQAHAPLRGMAIDLTRGIRLLRVARRSAWVWDSGGTEEFNCS